MTQLYEALFVVRDGEEEYSDTKYVLAKTKKQAQAYFNRELRDYWGTLTNYDRSNKQAWEKPFDCRCATIERVEKPAAIHIDNLETGGRSEIRFIIWKEQV